MVVVVIHQSTNVTGCNGLLVVVIFHQSTNITGCNGLMVVVVVVTGLLTSLVATPGAEPCPGESGDALSDGQ